MFINSTVWLVISECSKFRVLVEYALKIKIHGYNFVTGRGCSNQPHAHSLSMSVIEFDSVVRDTWQRKVKD